VDLNPLWPGKRPIREVYSQSVLLKRTERALCLVYKEEIQYLKRKARRRRREL